MAGYDPKTKSSKEETELCMIEAIIFDYAGVIAPHGTIRDICQWYTKEKGQNLDTFTTIFRKHWNTVKYHTVSPSFWNDLAKELQMNPSTLRKEILQLTQPDPQMISLVKQLKKHYTVALLSNHVQDWLDELLHEYSLDILFSCIVTSYSSNSAKPEETIYRTIQEKLRIPFAACVFTDDKEKNVRAAKKLGMHGFVFTSIDTFVNDLRGISVTI